MASNRTLILEECIRRQGFRRGAMVAEFITEWEVWLRSAGQDGGVEEFAQWWKDSPRTAYRRLANFRAAFPELGKQATPSALMGPLLERLRYDEPPYGVELADVPLDLRALA
jgi:hypothetical protein